MIQIRPANESDLDWLVGELREFDEFYKTKKKLFGDEAYVREKLVQLIRDQVFIVAEEAGRRLGFIAGIIQQHFYNPRIRVLVQLFWWVMPQYRRSLAASLLMDEFVAYGKDNADWITFNMAPMTPVNPSSFKRRGFVESDQVYLLEVE